MKLIKTATAILVTGMMLSFSPNQVNPKEEEKQIRKLWQEASEYIRTGNWEGYKNCWKQNLEFQVIHPFHGEWLNGWVQVREKYKKLLQSGVQFTTLKDDLTLYISKSGDMAWGTMDVIFQIGENQNNTVHVWETGAFEKIDGEWKFVMGMACNPKTTTTNAPDDLEAINQIRDNHVKAVNESDADLLLQDMSEDVIYLAPGLQPIEGKEALREFVTPVYEVVSITIQMTPEEIEINNNIAIEWGLISGEMKQNEADSIQYVKNKYLFVYEKFKGRWLITKDIYNITN